MSSRNFLILTALTTGTIGLVFILFPDLISDLFLTEASSSARLFTMFIGSSLLGYTYLNWATAKSENEVMTGHVLRANFVALIIALIISIFGLIDQNLKPAGILFSLMHGFYAAGFGVYILKEK